MSHKGSKSRVQDYKAWQESPLWDKKKPDYQKGLTTKEEHLEKEGEPSEPIDMLKKKFGNS